MGPASSLRLRAAGWLALWLLAAPPAWTQPATNVVDPMRGPIPIPANTRPPLLSNAINDDLRRPRNYDLQPPTIPHRVDGYQIDRNFNKCLDCHARDNTAFSHAIPVSATHYIDRDGKVLKHVSTRRYFCLQCHVPQDPTRPLVGNSFQNVEAVAPMIAPAAPAGQK